MDILYRDSNCGPIDLRPPSVASAGRGRRGEAGAATDGAGERHGAALDAVGAALVAARFLDLRRAASVRRR